MTESNMCLNIKNFVLKNFYYIPCWIFMDILNLLSETKINYWFKHLLNFNISVILVAIILVRTFIQLAYFATNK